jgi:Tfp pilus assembly protein PilO
MNNARTWIFGLGALIVVVIVAAWTLGISPTLDQVNVAESQVSSIQTSNAASAAQLASLKAEFADIKTFKTSLDKLRLSVPEAEAASAFLNEISVLTAQDGVTTQTLTLEDASIYSASDSTGGGGTSTTGATATATPAPTASPTTTVPTTAAPATTGSGLILVPINISVLGSLASVQQFISDLQLGQRLFVSTTTSLVTNTDNGSVTGTVGGNIFALKGTSDASPKTKLIPTPTITPTPTATPTPTPTPTATTSSTKSGAATGSAPVTAPVVAAPVPTPTDSSSPASP